MNSSSNSSSSNSSSSNSSSSSSASSAPRRYPPFTPQVYIQKEQNGISYEIRESSNPLLLVANNVNLDASPLVEEIANFNFFRSPAGVIDELAALGFDISMDRSSSAMDNYTKLTINNFSGTVLELLSSMFSFEYNSPLWTAAIAQNGSITISFGGGVLGSPKLDVYDPIPFIPPGGLE